MTDRADALVLPPADPRACHLRDVLRLGVGDAFDVGVVDGPRGRATIVAHDALGLHLALEWGAAPAPAPPLRVILGLSRPQTMRKVLREAAALGIRELHIARCSHGEAGYAQSSLWTGGEWRDQLLQGAEQAFTTRLPVLSHFDTLTAALAVPGAQGCLRLALDNYEATAPLDKALAPAQASVGVVLAIGPERGWTRDERETLRGAGFTLAHMGPLVLRTESAVIAACTAASAALGAWSGNTPSTAR